MIDLIEAEAAQLAVRKGIPGVMSKFRLKELSGVTTPAQEGARAVFMKRADDAPGRDPGSEAEWSARRDATRKAVDALAARKAAAEGLTFEKAYDAVLRDAPELAVAVI